MEKLRWVFQLGRTTLQEWWDDDALQLGAAFAYYTVFSLSPVLVIAIALAGLVFGEEAARGRIVAEFQGLMGPTGASAIAAVVQHASLEPRTSLVATALAAGTMLFGASSAFAQLQSALNQIWDAESPVHSSIWRLVRNRLLSFGMVLAIGFVLLVSLLIAALISALDQLLAARAPLLQPVLGVFQFVTSLLISTGLFAAIYKVLPDCEVRWTDACVGGAATALLFEVGKTAIGLYLGNSSVASMYGAAGSLLIVLLWVYYSSQIVFLGAEFTQVWSRRQPAKTRKGAQ